MKMNERGIALMEVLVCLFIFAVLMTGLLRYHQLLHTGKHRQYAEISTVRRLHQLMRFTADPALLRPVAAQHGTGTGRQEITQGHIATDHIAPGCISVTIGVISADTRRLTAGRWQCTQRQKHVYDLSFQ